MKKDRTIKEMDDYLENFSKEISKKINEKGKVIILDAGCGYGLVMAGLLKKFGNKVELIGYNLSKKDGTIKDLKDISLSRGIFSKDEIKKVKNWPKIIYLDANKKLPFKENSFDFIISLASVYLYKEKIKFFEECNRILKKGGTAKITLFETPKLNNKDLILDNLKIPVNSQNFWEIWDQGKEINFVDYFDRIKGIKVKIGERKDRKSAEVYVEIKKQPRLNMKLKLIGTINMGIIAPDRYGMRAIYAAELNFNRDDK